MNQLNEKQKRFCEEYLIDLNATHAAIKAGYSQSTAPEQGSRLLSNVKVQEYLSVLMIEQQARTEITADMVIKELAKIGFANIQDYIEDDNGVIDISTIDQSKAAAVSSVKKSVTLFDGGSKEVVEFKLWDKVAALEKLGRHLGVFEKDNIQQQGKIIVTIKDNE